MNPIPLTAPDGRVYAYACGVCHQVPLGSELFIPDRPSRGPNADCVLSSENSAEYCCTCDACLDPLEAGDFCVCGRCYWSWQMRQLWSSIATCAQHGFVTLEQYHAWLDRDDPACTNLQDFNSCWKVASERDDQKLCRSYRATVREQAR